MSDRTLETIVSDERLDVLIRYARQAGKPWLSVEVVDCLKELKRHRKLEHDHYWGEDDE